MWPLAILDYSRGGFLDWTTFRVEGEDEPRFRAWLASLDRRHFANHPMFYLYLVPISIDTGLIPHMTQAGIRDPDVTCYDDGDGCCFI